MTNTQRAALGIVAVALVALGLFLILGGEPGATLTPPAHVTEVEPGPTATTTTTTTPPTAPSQPTSGYPAAAVVAAVPDAGEPVAKTGPVVELAPSPFEGSDSPELQYAVKLVLSETTGPYEWHKAAEVFQRCVDQNPTNHLCKRGVYAAWERIDSDGGRPTALTRTGAFDVGSARLQDATERPDGLVAPTLKARALQQ